MNLALFRKVDPITIMILKSKPQAVNNAAEFQSWMCTENAAVISTLTSVLSFASLLL